MSHPYIPFANCAAVELIGSFSGQVTELTMGVRKGSAFAGSDLDDIADEFESWWHSTLRLLITASYSMDRVKVTDLTTVSSPIVDRAITGPNLGSLAVAVAPSNVSAVIKFTTESRGRSYRGRNYVCGFPASDMVSPGEIGSTFRADLTTAYTDLASSLGIAGFDHVVLSRFNLKLPRVVGVASRVTGYSTRAPIGTQRRRVPGVGV